MIAFEKIDLTPNLDQSRKGLSQKKQQQKNKKTKQNKTNQRNTR